MTHASRHNPRSADRRSPARCRGAAALLAMMFLVIFASLATAMAILAQGNLRTADSQLKVNRALAAAQTGMDFVTFRLNQVLAENENDQFTISQGEVDTTVARQLWTKISHALLDSLTGDPQFGGDQPSIDGYGALRLPSIPVGPGPGRPQFTAVLMEHPIDAVPKGHPLYQERGYDNAYYQRPPYDGSQPETGITSSVSSANKLDARWVRIRVEATAGDVTRSISMDFRIEKKIRAAILSKSRVMIGHNVMIQGRIGSNFMDTTLPNGHPIQMESDFHGLTDGLDDELDTLTDDLRQFDLDGDNRIRIATEIDPAYQDQMRALDDNHDGYVDGWDRFMAHFDAHADGRVSRTELETGGVDPMRAQQLVTLIDTFHDTPQPDADKGVIDEGDRYAKVRGEVLIKASRDDWEGADGAAGPDKGTGRYQDYFQGPIDPKHGKPPLEFSANDSSFPAIDQKDFGVSVYRSKVDPSDDVAAQAASPVDSDPDDGLAPEANPAGTGKLEAVPFGSAHPYDHYDRPIYKNMEFNNVFIPEGTNALFVNCTFKGVTYVEIEGNNDVTDPNDSSINDFNYSGMQEDDGSEKFPDRDANFLSQWKNEHPGSTVNSSKDLSNNIRFDKCRFEGSVVSGGKDGTATQQPDAYSNTRNKLTFTGRTEFPDVTDPTQTPGLSPAQREMFRRGRLIAPHISVEMGTFDAARTQGDGDAAPEQTLHLTGTIVAGVLDMRGNVRIDGSIITTFDPSGDAADEPGSPVIGDTSPQFNTTLGYFTDKAGDEEAGDTLPVEGMGVIQVRYDPTLPLPDGILSRVSVTPLHATYTEGGAAPTATP